MSTPRDLRSSSSRPFPFVRTYIKATVHHARKAEAVALVVEQRRVESVGIKVGIAGIDGWTVHEQRMRHGWTAVILQWAELRIGIANVARAVEQTAGAGRAVSARGIVTEVVTQGCDRAVRTNAPAGQVGIEDGI